jgi:hypothetical protein
MSQFPMPPGWPGKFPAPAAPPAANRPGGRYEPPDRFGNKIYSSPAEFQQSQQPPPMQLPPWLIDPDRQMLHGGQPIARPLAMQGRPPMAQASRPAQTPTGRRTLRGRR